MVKEVYKITIIREVSKIIKGAVTIKEMIPPIPPKF